MLKKVPSLAFSMNVLGRTDRTRLSFPAPPIKCAIVLLFFLKSWTTSHRENLNLYPFLSKVEKNYTKLQVITITINVLCW